MKERGCWRGDAKEGEEERRTGCLVGAFQQDFRRAEAPRAGAVGAARRPGVVFRVSRCGEDSGGGVELGAVVGAARAGGAVGALALGQAKVHQHPAPAADVVQEVRRLDVAVQDAVGVHGGQGGEQRAEVHPHVRHGEVAEVLAEVDVAEVRQHRDHLVLVPEGGDERADGVAAAQVVEQLELVLDPVRRRGDVDLLDRHVLRASSRGERTGGRGRGVARSPLLEGRGGPFRHVARLEVPVVVVGVVVEVLRLVHRREGAFADAVDEAEACGDAFEGVGELLNVLGDGFVGAGFGRGVGEVGVLLALRRILVASGQVRLGGGVVLGFLVEVDDERVHFVVIHDS